MAKRKESADKEAAKKKERAASIAPVKVATTVPAPQPKGAPSAKREPLTTKQAEKKESAAVIAPLNVATTPVPPPKPARKGKLLPKHKSRLPRKLKKAQKKAALLL